MARFLGEDAPEVDEDGHFVGDAQLAARYAEAAMAMGKQRILGYMVQALAGIHAHLARGETDAARCLTLRSLAAADQSCLDNHWRTAWEITGLRLPPFGAWSAADTATLRQQHAASPLLQPEWVAAYVGKAKDYEALVKRRSGGRKTNKDGDE